MSKEWPPSDVLRWCYRNSFNSGRDADGYIEGAIVDQLKESLRGDKDYLTIAHDGEKLVGWSMTYMAHKWMFQAYVPPRQRRKGIGSKLLTKACSIVGRVEVYDIDTSNKFFKANGLTKGEAITGNRLKLKKKI